MLKIIIAAIALTSCATTACPVREVCYKGSVAYLIPAYKTTNIIWKLDENGSRVPCTNEPNYPK